MSLPEADGWMATGNSLSGPPFRELLDEYAGALRDYLATTNPSALTKAEELGRTAIARGMSALTVAAVHHRAAMAALLRMAEPEDQTGAVEALRMFCASCPAWYWSSEAGRETGQALEVFFLHVLKPFEELQRRLRTGTTVMRRLQEAREQEARRIAHTLHDDLAQLLVSVHLVLDDVDCDEAHTRRARILEARRLLEEFELHLRQLSHELRPTILDDLGLAAALDFLVQGISKRSGILMRLEVEAAGRFPAPIETALYRIVQEALANVVRHARARSATVWLYRDAASVRCSIRDDGTGLDAAAVLKGTGERGLGLLGIRERVEALGGALVVTSHPGQGAELVATLPLPPPVLETAEAGGEDATYGSAEQIFA